MFYKNKMKINLLNNVNSYYFNNILPNKNIINFCASTDTFEAQWKKDRDEFVEKLNKYNLVNKKHLKKVAKAQNEYELSCAIEAIYQGIFAKYEDMLSSKENLSDCQKAQKFKRTTLDFEKHIKNNESKLSTELIEIFKSLSQKDTNPKILKIKETLKNHYGIKDMYFDNDINSAELFLDAMKLLKEKDFPLPDNIVINKHFPAGGIAVRLNGQSTILMNSDFESNLRESSTDSPIHKIIHEAVHCIQPNLIAFNTKHIPKIFEKTISNISEYAEGNFAHEIYAELVAKMLIEELSPEEEILLKYLENNL